MINAETSEVSEVGDVDDVSEGGDAGAGLEGQGDQVRSDSWEQRGRGCENIRLSFNIHLTKKNLVVCKI